MKSQKELSAGQARLARQARAAAHGRQPNHAKKSIALAMRHGRKRP